MNLLSKIIKKIKFNYQLYIKQDPFLLEVQKWFNDKGDQTLRLDYELNESSVVFDVGGYQGDFAQQIYNKYGCSVYVFEPVKEYYETCVERFKGNPKIKTLNYGLSSSNCSLNISVAENASSLFRSIKSSDTSEIVSLRSVIDVIDEMKVDYIDLIKINIEGGEFDILPSIMQSAYITKVGNIQVQFHNFVHNAVKLRDDIRHDLCATHKEMWNYEFVWESWKLKKD